MDIHGFKRLAFSVAKYGASSFIATVVDIGLFTFILTKFLPVFESELISGFVGMVINFFLQKKMVFDLRRNQYIAFLMTIAFSLILLFLGGVALQTIVRINFFGQYVVLAKIVVMSFKFFINYFTKRWIFEKRGITLKAKSNSSCINSL